MDLLTQDIQDQVLPGKFLLINLELVEQETLELVELAPAVLVEQEHQGIKELLHYLVVEQLINQDIRLEEIHKLEHLEWAQHHISQLIKVEVAYNLQEQDIKLILELALVMEQEQELALEQEQVLALLIKQQQLTGKQVKQVDRQARQVKQEAKQVKVVTQQAKEETNQDKEVLITVVHIAQQINDWISEILLN